MFICEPCLEERYENWSFFKSHGKCECCDSVAACHDIPSSRLVLKEKVCLDTLLFGETLPSVDGKEKR